MTKVRNLETLLTSLLDSSDDEDVTVEELLEAVGRRSHGPVILMLGFVTVSPLTLIPGANWLVALVTLIFSFQVLMGQKRPWLPRRALQFSFDEDLLERGVAIASPWARRIDKFVKPRLSPLTTSPFLQLAAIACIGASLITFPLGLVPFGPVAPGLTLIAFGLALSARDGILLLLALVLWAASVYLLIRMIPRIVEGYEHFLSLIGLG